MSSLQSQAHSSDIQIFDRHLLRQKRARAARQFHDYVFLHEWAHDNLRDRLSVIKRDYDRIVQIGARGGAILEDTHKHAPAVICDTIPDFFTSGQNHIHLLADEEFLPFQDQSLDLVISSLNMHSVNDLPGTLLQIRKSLKPDGLFLAALFGGESLYELRQSLSETELALKGGGSPRVFPFADKQEMGALLQRAGFALPVVDSDIVKVSYDNMFKLLQDLRGMGESNIIAARDQRYVGREFFFKAAQYYANHFQSDEKMEQNRITASFEVIFLLGWAPHNNQQKPLNPGSATGRLADALDTKETSL